MKGENKMKQIFILVSLIAACFFIMPTPQAAAEQDATITDIDGNSVKVSNLKTGAGREKLRVKFNESIVTIPFSKIAKIHFIDNYKTFEVDKNALHLEKEWRIVVTFRTGEVIEDFLYIHHTQSRFEGDFKYGRYSIPTLAIKTILFLILTDCVGT